jgi:putative transposase
MSSALIEGGGAGPWSLRHQSGKPRTRVAPEVRQRITSRLLELRASNVLHVDHVRQAAAGAGVSERSVWRWLVAPPAPATQGFRLSETDRAAFADFRGNVAAVHRTREAALAGRSTAAGIVISAELSKGWRGSEPVGLRTLQKAFRREMEPAERAYWKAGMKARRDLRVYGKRVVAHRNALWQVDHTQLDIVVLPPRGPAQRPWLTTFKDHHTRAVMGWAISLHPDSGSVTSALRSAIVCDAESGGHGGIPAVIEHDHAWEFGAKVLKAACDTMCILLKPVAAYEGRGKGSVERWHETIDQLLLCQLPGFTKGARDLRGHLYGPVRDDRKWRELAEKHGDDLLTIDAFTRLFADWVRWFNLEHPHSGIDGQSPIEAWQADPTPISVLPDSQLRDLLLVAGSRVITSSGVQLFKLHYVADEIEGKGGERVDVRYAPHDRRFIELYRDGVHLATAHPSDAMTPEQSEQRRDAWTAESRRLGVLRRKAIQRARRRLEPLNARSDTAQDTLTTPRTAPYPPNGSAHGSTSLLGLTDPQAQPDSD